MSISLFKCFNMFNNLVFNKTNTNNFNIFMCVCYCICLLIVTTVYLMWYRNVQLGRGG